MPVTPNLQIKSTITEFSDFAWWSEDDNTNDPFIGYPYQWKVTFSCEPQPHSDHTTRAPNIYTGMDIQVGDWFVSEALGRATIIQSIESQDDFTLVGVVEDLERYNLFTDPNQSGAGMSAPYVPGVIFRMGNDGLPVIGPVEDLYLPNKAVEDLLARFIARNGVSEFILVRQENHGMFPGDVIYADFEANLGYKKTNAANINRAIGIVTESNVPGLNYFSYRPLGKLINNVNPPLFGEHGDIFYLDPNEPGALTNVKPLTNAFPVYLQLDLPTRAILLTWGIEASGKPEGSDSQTNKYDIENVTAGQRTFTLPDNAKEVLYMAINGIENENFTFNEMTKVLTFDPVETGYGVDVDDEVFFFYKT
jgi:hypothetical protein